MSEFLTNETLMLATGLLLGAILGSFLNVCAHRIPLGQSVISPRSYCPQCKEVIRWFRNLPVLTWLVQGGKAKCCGIRIPMRYWLVEAFLAMAFGLLFHRYVQAPDAGQLLSGCFFVWCMIAVVVIDMQTMLIPDRFSMGGAVLGVLVSIAFPSIHMIHSESAFLGGFAGGLNALIGLLIGSATLYWIGILAEKALKKEALGEGDVKLMGCIGAFCGWKGSLFAIFGGATLGVLLLVPAMLLGRLRSGEGENGDGLSWGKEIPFGPYLALAALLYLLGIRPWVDAWFDSLGWILSGR